MFVCCRTQDSKAFDLGAKKRTKKKKTKEDEGAGPAAEDT